MKRLYYANDIIVGSDSFSIMEYRKRLLQTPHPVGRALETENYYVWCNSPIYIAGC